MKKTTLFLLILLMIFNVCKSQVTKEQAIQFKDSINKVCEISNLLCLTTIEGATNSVKKLSKDRNSKVDFDYLSTMLNVDIFLDSIAITNIELISEIDTNINYKKSHIAYLNVQLELLKKLKNYFSSIKTRKEENEIERNRVLCISMLNEIKQKELELSTVKEMFNKKYGVSSTSLTTMKNTWLCSDGDCINGYATKTWADGGVEKGYWKNGKIEGKGYRFFGTSSDFSGDSYTGNFKEDQFSGNGTYYDKSEDSKYKGKWKDGKPNGKGICKWGNNSKYPNRYYDGEWKDGKMNGKGTKFWGNAGKYTNNKYVGEWSNNKMNGYGKYTWADGSYYKGQWLNDEQDGDGIYCFKNGEIFKGHWEEGYCPELEKILRNKQTN